MMDYAGLSAVAAVAQEGSFEKAAKLLRITPSAVSQRVKLLEERIGTVLIVRGQPCRATPQGELICRHIEQVRLLEDSLSQRLPTMLGSNDRDGHLTLPVAVNADSLATWFLDATTEFSKRTGYLLNLFIDDQEHTAEWLRMGRVVGVVTAHDRPVQGCKSLYLGSMRYHAAASPAFIKRYFPDGLNASALSLAPAFLFDRKDRLQEQWIHKITGRSLNFPVHWIPSTQGFIDAGIKGLGWGVSPIHLLQSHFDSGALVDLCPGQFIDVPLYWQINGIAAHQLTDLTNCIVTTARAWLDTGVDS